MITLELKLRTMAKTTVREGYPGYLEDKIVFLEMVFRCEEVCPRDWEIRL
jgi:hypothetical protein